MPKHETLLDLLNNGVRHDHETAFSFWDGARPLWYRKNISFEELRDLAQRFACCLSEDLKIVPGERIALILPNTIQFPIAYFAALYAGLVVVPINPILGAGEMKKILDDSGASAVISLTEISQTVKEAAEGTDVRNFIYTRISDSLPFLKAVMYDRRLKKIGKYIPFPTEDVGSCKYSDILTAAQYEYSISAKPKDIAAIIYTSGTSAGEPKGAVMTHGALMENAKACRDLLVFDLGVPKSKLIFLAAAPYFHIMGLVTMMHVPLLLDAEVILVSDKNFVALARKILSAMSYAKVFGFVGAPKHYQFMNAVLKKHSDEYDLSQLRVAVSGSEALSQSTRTDFEKYWSLSAGKERKVLEGFGMTEGGILICQRPWNKKAGSIGRVLPGVEAKIFGLLGNDSGELVIKSKSLMHGYWRKNKGVDWEKTSEAIDWDGRLHTGDLARIDKDGEIFLAGRIKDIIKVGGEIVAPLEVENVIAGCPFVEEAAVVGMFDQKQREVPAAFVVLKEGVKENPAEIKKNILAHCRRHLSEFKIPSKIEFVDSLPKNEFGKVLKRKLRAL